MHRSKNNLTGFGRGFDEYLSRCYLDVLDCVTLRSGITREMALEYFLAASEMFNSYFRKKAEQNGDYRPLIEDHEGRMSAIFDIMLYGIAEQSTEERLGEEK